MAAEGSSLQERRNGALALPGKVTPTSLVLADGLPFEEWESAGKLLGEISRATQWWIGDWLNYGEGAYGDKYTQAMDATGLEYGTLANISWVSKHVEVSRRRENLSFSHHQEVAQFDPGEQRTWLKQAEAAGWSVGELRKEIKQAPAVEEPNLCPSCKRPMPKVKS